MWWQCSMHNRLLVLQLAATYCPLVFVVCIDTLSELCLSLVGQYGEPLVNQEVNIMGRLYLFFSWICGSRRCPNRQEVARRSIWANSQPGKCHIRSFPSIFMISDWDWWKSEILSHFPCYVQTTASKEIQSMSDGHAKYVRIWIRSPPAYGPASIPHL